MRGEPFQRRPAYSTLTETSQRRCLSQSPSSMPVRHVSNHVFPKAMPRSLAKVPVQRRTIAAYVERLVEAKVLYRCPRFDLKSRKSLRGEEKYYLADPGIYFVRNVDVRLNYGPALGNALYVYLRAQGYKLSAGRIGKLECDFIARKRNEYAYIQVSLSIVDPAVEEREYRPFRSIRDGYPRFLFTFDPLLQEREGVKHLNLIDFMASGGELMQRAKKKAAETRNANSDASKANTRVVGPRGIPERFRCPWAGARAACAACFFCLSKALTGVLLSIAYATWGAVGIVLI